MKINDQWSIECGPGGHDFTVVEHSYGTNPKTQLPTHSEKRSYHPSLGQAFRKIIRTETLDATSVETLNEFSDRIAQTENWITEKVKHITTL